MAAVIDQALADLSDWKVSEKQKDEAMEYILVVSHH
jgi:hypothetical protein